jgi:DNA-binding beta-propeller fold protein YncE
VALSSPWDLALDGGWLYVSMVGTHQVWRINLGDGRVSLWAGSGFEGAVDGLRADADLAQPSGLALDGAGRLYFADAESSSIRWTHVDGEIEWLGTLVGGQGSLFAFGDVDGVGDEVRLQHPLGVAYDNDAGALYIADTYNHKIKRLDPETRRVDTYLGGERGWRDGADPLFYEPSDLDLAGGQLYVADTNNHAIRVVDLQTGETRTLALRGIERLLPEKGVMPGDTVSFDPVQVGAGAGRVVLDVELPPGHKLSELASSAVVWHVEGDVVALPGADGEPVAIDALPLEMPVTFEQGQGELVGDLFLGYCRTGQEGICFLEQVRLRAPVTVGGIGEPVLRIVHRVTLPNLGRPE